MVYCSLTQKNNATYIMFSGYVTLDMTQSVREAKGGKQTISTPWELDTKLWQIKAYTTMCKPLTDNSIYMSL